MIPQLVACNRLMWCNIVPKNDGSRKTLRRPKFSREPTNIPLGDLNRLLLTFMFCVSTSTEQKAPTKYNTMSVMALGVEIILITSFIAAIK